MLSIAAGAVNARGPGRALEQASGELGAHLEYTSTAQRKADIPTFAYNMPAPSVKVGAGGQGAKADDVQACANPLSEQVGKMAEKASLEDKEDTGHNKPGTVLRERNEDEKPNPKKRMWEVCISIDTFPSRRHPWRT